MKKNRVKRIWRDRICLPRRGSFLRAIFRLRFLVTLAGLLLFGKWLSQIWIVQYAGIAGMDTFLNAQPPQEAKRCRIVGIREQDYESYFKGRSPLAPDKLAAVLRKILELQPAVVAVTIDTSSALFRQMAVPSSPTPIVWARSATEVGGELKPRPVLGSRDIDPDYWGLALFSYSLDWSIRTYPRFFRFGSKNWPSFHWAIVKAYCQVPLSDSGCGSVREVSNDGELAVPVFHSRYKIPVLPLSDILIAERAALDNPLRNKIVLLGGYYLSSDKYHTPFGLAADVELVGNAVEAEFSPIKQRRIQAFEEFVLKIFLALLVVWFHHTLRPRYALGMTILVLCTMVVAGSYIAFRFSAYRADFLPFLVGIWIEQLFESADQAHKYTLTSNE